MTWLKNWLFSLARGCIAIIFLVSGVMKVISWQNVQEGLTATLCDWHVYFEGSLFVEQLLDFLFPLVPLLLAAATFFELVGGVLALFRKTARLGAVFLLIFLLPVTFVYHAFWFEIGDQFQQQAIKFLSNFAIIGGLLLLAIFPCPKKDGATELKKRFGGKGP